MKTWYTNRAFFRLISIRGKPKGLLSAYFFALMFVFVLTSTKSHSGILTLDTEAFRGASGFIAYDLIDGTPNATSVLLLPYAIDGLFFGGSEILEDQNFFNSIERPLVLGGELSIIFEIHSAGVPEPGFFPDSFAIFLLDDFGFPIFPTLDPTGADALLQWDIGSIEPSVFAGNYSEQSSSRISEPPMYILFIIGAALLFLMYKRRRSFQFLPMFAAAALVALLCDVSASNAISISSTTDLGAETSTSSSGLRFNRRTRTFDSVVTVKNVSNSVIEGPITIAVMELPENVTLVNATATTDEGVPFVSVEIVSEADEETPVSLESGDEIDIVLKFFNASFRRFPLNLRVIRFSEPVPNLVAILGPDADQDGVRDDLLPMLQQRYEVGSLERAAAVSVLKEIRLGLAGAGAVETAFEAAVDLHGALVH